VYPCPGEDGTSGQGWANCDVPTSYPTSRPTAKSETAAPTKSETAAPTSPTSRPSAKSERGGSNSNGGSESDGDGETMAIAGAGVAVLLLLVAAGAFLWWRRGKRGTEKAPQQQEEAGAGAPDVIPRLTENPLHNPGNTVTTTAAVSRKSAVPADLYPEEDIEGSMADMDIEMIQ
jgi:hypothetical protein